MTDGAVLQIATTFEVIYCYKCHCPFAVPADIRKRWLASGIDFYCPNGHPQHYTDSTEQVLRKELEAEKRRKDAALARENEERAKREAAERRLAAAKGQATKLRKRVGHGVCPCCNRTFAQLARHMQSKHPDFAGAEQQES